MKRPTIKDIAREANVSLATVSRALNHDPCVTDTMQARVMTTAKRLGYVPNSIAKSLKTNSTYTIGFLVSDISNNYYISIARSVEDIVSRQNYNLMLCSTGNQQGRELDYLQMLMSKNIDGLILNTTGLNNDFILEMNKKTPIVLLNRRIMHEKFKGDLVDTNSYLGCYKLTKQLLAMGHRKIYVVRGPAHLSNSFERFQGFADAMSEVGITIDNDYPYVYTGEFTLKSGEDSIHYMQQMEDMPTAILSQNNMMTVGILKELRRCMIRIPEDISLVSYDSINYMDLMMTRPTSASFDMAAIGEKVGQLILNRIKNPETPNREYIFDPTITPGNSLGIPRD